MSFTFEDGVIKCKDVIYNENCGGIGHLFFKAMKKYSKNVAQIDSVDDSFDTFESLLSKSVKTAIQLRNRGITKQDLVGICANKCLNAPVPIFAGQFLGAITFALDPALSKSECVELLTQVKPNIIFVVKSALEMITEAFKDCNIETQIVIFEENFEMEFLRYVDEERYFTPVLINDLSTTCYIHFSSGTTSSPKPICLNHYYAIYGLNHYCHDEILSKIRKPVSLRFSNWYWISATLELITYTIVGGCRIMWNSFIADELWNYLHKYKITSMFLSPTQCIELLNTKNPYPDEPLSLVDLFTGGTVIPKEYILPLRKLFPNAYVYQLYGMTEAGMVCQFKRQILSKPLSCGVPINGYWYKIVDVETEKKLGPDQPGELRIKAKHIFRTFYNKEATESFDEEGYFKTGDMMYFDQEFCFFVVDRLKAILGWKDYVIYPIDIEKVIVQHPAVKDAIVIGIPHKIESERLLGVVVIKSNARNVTEQEIETFVKEKVPDHHRLREGVRFIESIPLTITGKVNRRKVKEIILAKYYSQYSDLSYLNPRSPV